MVFLYNDGVCVSGDNLWDEGSFLMAFSNIRNSHGIEFEDSPNYNHLDYDRVPEPKYKIKHEQHPRGTFSYDSETGYIQGVSGNGIVSKSNRMYLNNKYNRVSWAIDEKIKSTENDEWEFIDRYGNNIKTFQDNRVSVDSFSYMGNGGYEIAFPTGPDFNDSQYDFW